MILNCNYCGKEVERSNWKAKNYKHAYCNRRCYEKDKTKQALVTRYCDHCGSPVTRIKAKFRNRERIFCNLSCSGKYGHESHQVVLKCSKCGRERKMMKCRSKRKGTLCRHCDRLEKVILMRKRMQEKAEFKIIPCSYCKKPLKRSKKDRGRAVELFCDNDCCNKYNADRKSENPFILCLNCGDPRQINICQIGITKYCSRKCKHESQKKRIEIICDYCKKKYVLRPFEIEKRRKIGCIKHYCSRGCYNEDKFVPYYRGFVSSQQR